MVIKTIINLGTTPPWRLPGQVISGIRRRTGGQPVTGDKFKKAGAALTRVHKLFVAGVKRRLGIEVSPRPHVILKIKKKIIGGLLIKL